MRECIKKKNKPLCQWKFDYLRDSYFNIYYKFQNMANLPNYVYYFDTFLKTRAANNEPVTGNYLVSSYYIVFQPDQNTETRQRSNFHTLAVEDKNIFFTFFLNITAVIVKWLYQGVVTFHSIFQNLHSFELMLGSSRPQVSCEKITLKCFSKFTGKHLCRSPFFLRKLQNACDFIKKETPENVFYCEFSEIFRGNFFTGHMRTATSECILLSTLIYMFSDFSEKKKNKL